jgi:hypothetical protein
LIGCNPQAKLREGCFRRSLPVEEMTLAESLRACTL